jgi:hypothetical protein
VDTGTVIALIALILASFSSAVSAFQLQRHIRFRKPIFVVESASLSVHRGEEMAMVTLRELRVNARGARQPITLNNMQVMFIKEQGRDRSGTGGGVNAVSVTIEPEVWTYLPLGELIGTGIGVQDALPHSFLLELYLSNPRDIFIVPMQFKLSQDAMGYNLDDMSVWHYMNATVWRERSGIRRTVRAVLSKLAIRR